MAQILLIEDNDLLRDTIKKLLENKGYKIMVASDGEEGLKMFRSDPAEVVITDIIMPNKDGVETIFELYKYFPAVSVIAISGGGKAPAEDYLNSIKLLPNVKYIFKKPFANYDLLMAIKDLIPKN